MQSPSSFNIFWPCVCSCYSHSLFFSLLFHVMFSHLTKIYVYKIYIKKISIREWKEEKNLSIGQRPYALYNIYLLSLPPKLKKKVHSNIKFWTTRCSRCRRCFFLVSRLLNTFDSHVYTQYSSRKKKMKWNENRERRGTSKISFWSFFFFRLVHFSFYISFHIFVRVLAVRRLRNA